MPDLHELIHIANSNLPVYTPVYTPVYNPTNTGQTSNVPNIYANMSTLSKFLTLATSLAAIKAGASQIPTANNQQQLGYNPYANPNINPLTGLPYAPVGDTNEKFGAKVQRIFEENTTTVLIVGAVGLAYLAKSPRKRNGLYSDAKRKLKRLLK